MSFSATIPATSFADFEDAVIAAKASPKPDGRTKKGKIEKGLFESAQEGLVNIACEALPFDFSGVVSGTISGHVSTEEQGSVSVGFSFGPKPSA